MRPLNVTAQVPLCLTALVEDTSPSADLLAEHGLALLLETDRGAVLFDTGASTHALTANAAGRADGGSAPAPPSSSSKAPPPRQAVRSVTGAARAADETNRASTLVVRSNTVVEYVYGPVLSRRLGRSLGVDLVPLKICTYDCVYCQLGRTTNKTLERREYVPLPDVLSQLDRRLRDEPALDFITLAGSGEPTLYARLPEVIRAVKQRTATPLAVLTNGSLLWDPQVRDSLREADLVIPSLDAGDERLFQYVNRPHQAISFEKMVSGLVAFRHGFAKPIWLEVFLLGGVTAIASEVEKIARLVDQIRPDRVQLNTVARPPAEAFAMPAPNDQLRAFAAMFGHRGEVIAARPDSDSTTLRPAMEADILNLLRRRPCTLRDLADGLRLHPAEAMKQIDRLLASGLLTAASEGGQVFYRAPPIPLHRQRPNPTR